MKKEASSRAGASALGQAARSDKGVVLIHSNSPLEECPIERKIGAVFVPVTDINRSVAWYNRLLQRPTDAKFDPQVKSETRTVYSIRLGETSLLLDSMNREELKASPNHLFYLNTKNIHAAYRYLRELHVDIVKPESEEQAHDVWVIVIRDPDGNKILIHREG